MKESSIEERILDPSICDYFFKEETFLGPWIVEDKENSKDKKLGGIVITSFGASGSPNEIALYGAMSILKIKRTGVLKTKYKFFSKNNNLIGTFYDKFISKSFTKKGVLEDEKGKTVLIVNNSLSEIKNLKGQKIAYFTYKNGKIKKPKLLRQTSFELHVTENNFDKKLLLGISIAIHYGYFAFSPGVGGM
ncbi:MAG: hypothetical protein OEM21_10405 [Nitrosopumilus sp.]|nr:hypothetical protein [Nitrosopumilus sp.]